MPSSARQLLAAFAMALLHALPVAAQERLNFVLNWIPGGDHAPFYYALSQGWYKAAGIDLGIEAGKGSNASIQQIGLGRVQLGISDMATALVARGQGSEAVAVFAIYENSPYGIYWLKSSGIRSIKDFPGRTIGNPPGDAARVMWPALAKTSGIDPNSVKWVNITAQSKVAALQSRAVEIITDFYNGHDLKVNTFGADMGYMSFRDAGYLKTNRNTIDRFVKVTQRAYAFCVANGRTCIDALVAASTGQDLKVQLDQWERVKELMSDDYARSVALGGFDPKRMEADYSLIATYFSLAKPFDIKTAYTNEFLDRNVRMPK
jgi:NitT/TauT family transport system substrate-binding protein